MKKLYDIHTLFLGMNELYFSLNMIYIHVNNFFQFCDQGKKYAECVNKRLQCCDLKSEHTGALAAFDVGLQQNVRS